MNQRRRSRPLRVQRNAVVQENAGAVDLASAAGWQVEKGSLFLLAARQGRRSTGPRTLVAELPAGAIVVTGSAEVSLADGIVLLGVPSTSARIHPLTARELRDRLAGAGAPGAVAASTRALWSGVEGIIGTAGGVIALEPGSVAVTEHAAAESAEDVVWVQAARGAAELPTGPLGPDGALVAPRVRVAPVDGAVELDVRDLADLGAADARRALAALLVDAVDRARRAAAAEDERVRATEQERADSDSAFERLGVSRLAEAVTGPGTAPVAPAVGDAFLAVAAIVGNQGGFRLSAEPASVAGREGIRAVEALARSAGVRYRRVRLEGDWWRRGADAMLGYRPDGEPLALIPGRRSYAAITADGRTEALTRDNAHNVLGVAFTFSPPAPLDTDGSRPLVDFIFRGVRADLVVLMLLGLVAGILGLAVPLATGVVFDQIVPQGDTERLVWLVAVLFIVAVGSALIQMVQVSRQIRIETRAARRFGEATWDRLLSLPTTVATRYGIGDLAGRIVGVDNAREVLAQTGMGTAATLLASLLVIIVLFVYDVRLAVVAIVAGAAALAVTLMLAAAVGRRSEAFQERVASVNGFLLEVLRGLPKLRVAGGEARAFEAWAMRFAPAMGTDLARTQGTLQVVISLLNPLGTLVLFSAVATGGGATAIGVGTFLAFQATYSQYLGTVGQLATTVGTAWQVRPLLRRAASVVEEPPETGGGRADPGALRGSVELRDVVFRYNVEAAPILDSVDLRAAPGEFLAIVGRSGSGKSTIVRLLLGFESPEAGSVLYDERELGSVDVAAVRRQLGVVLQDSQLTPGTVLENIAAGLDIDEEQAWRYAELAAAADDLRAMPMGMQTMVTPGAGAFSGGQRQRLLLARALARQPAVLILDEATSALDNVTQGVVARNVAHLGITRIVIAHRLSTIASADRIVVLDQGRVSEQGTHDVLMARKGAYAALVSRQVV